jgi:hypothetical protein
MTINLDQYTNTLSVTDTATNADITFVTKGAGAIVSSGPFTATGQTSLGGVAGAEGLRVNVVASSVNYVAIQGDTSISPKISAAGAGTNLNLLLSSKGVGGIGFYTNGLAQQQFAVTHTASAVNYVQATGAATGSGPTISAQGSDANINLNLNAKGTSGVVLNTNSIDAVLVKSSIPTMLGSTLTTNLSNKYFVIGSRQYTTTEVGTTLIGSENTSTANTVYIGGYYGELNAATQIDFYTAGTVAERSGSKQFRVANTASAVNYVQVTGNATGGGPSLSAQGSDSNVSLVYIGKGIGGHVFTSGNGANIQLVINNTTSAVNFHQFTGSATGFGVVHSAAGSDTNIDLTLTPKGTGNVRFGTYTGTILTPTGYVEIKDSGGTVRRLLVG